MPGCGLGSADSRRKQTWSLTRTLRAWHRKGTRGPDGVRFSAVGNGATDCHVAEESHASDCIFIK